MSRAKRMERIATLAAMTRQVAAQELARTRTTHEQNLARLAQFRQYRAEYALLLGETVDSLNAGRARDLRQFIAQIERTIEVLDRQTRLSAQACGTAMQGWQAAARRNDALDGLLADARADGRMLQEGREQRELDDRGGRGEDS